MEEAQQVQSQVDESKAALYREMESRQNPPQQDLERFKKYVADSRWQYAKTYAKTFPHAYTIRAWRPEAFDEFNWAAGFIKKNGIKGKFFKTTYHYFYLNGWKYWVIMDVINREGVTRDFNQANLGQR
jgi:hypothetical protein